MNGSTTLYSWFCEQQFQADMTALQSALLERPDRQAQWLGVRTPDEARAFVTGLGLSDDHQKRLQTQFQVAAAMGQLAQEFTELVLPSPTPAYGSALAPTPYQIVWENEQAQLLCYGGEGAPVFWVPAVINKHYVLDLCPRRSVIQRQLELGGQVFSLVWRNPVENAAPQDYLDSIHQALALFDSPPHLAGYCLGGVLAAAAVVQGARASTLSLIATPLDGQMGELAHWFTPLQREHMQRCAQARGRVPAGVLSAGFLSLKPNSWGGLFNQARYPELATWLLDGLDVSPAMWDWITQQVYGEGGALARYDLAQIDIPVWSQSFDQDHLVPPQNFECAGGVLSTRAPGGHNGGLLRLGWLDGWMRWIGSGEPVSIKPIETQRDDLRESASAL